MSRIELGYSYELGSGWTRIRVLTRPRKRSGTVMTMTRLELRMSMAHKTQMMVMTTRLVMTKMSMAHKTQMQQG